MTAAKFLKRTCTCGEIRKEDVGKTVVLNGWVDNWRDHGGVRFIDLRDRYGKTQIVFDCDKNKEMHDRSKGLRREFVLAAKGTVEARPEGMINPKLPTGEIEVRVEELEVLNEAKTTPFEISEASDIGEELRLKYRYLDLRRAQMQNNIRIRHKCYQVVHNYFDKIGFLEIETPTLMKSTPEGARDYLVPSRVFPGSFYALPQSPQTYKQILMVAGMDKYVQIVKCFRDEDLRADRQPEFTQIDVEMSFVEEDDVFAVIEGMFVRMFDKVLEVGIGSPFMRMTYDEAMNRYGSDKPDLRWKMPIGSINDAVSASAFQVFSGTVSAGGLVCGITVKGKADVSRRIVDELTDYARGEGAKGLVALKVTEDGLQGGAAKFLEEDVCAGIVETMEAAPGDLLLIVADEKETALQVMGNLRLHVIKKFEIPPETDYSILWVTDFPLFEYDEESRRYTSMHHPFTMPNLDDLEYLETDPLKVRSRGYDIVLNGYEVGGGSIRIHRPDLQQKIFSFLGIDEEKARQKFGFLLEAFDYGAPPHGGIALGLDRIVMIFADAASIRDVIAFPKTNRAFSPMDETPSEVDEEQLEELGLKIVPRKSDPGDGGETDE
ncbi:aspartate--tRNA ligase [candidate division KSB1 bacterium]